MPNSPIASLALLKVNYDLYGRDYLEQFVPLVAECVRSTRPEVVSVPEIQNQLKAQFGLDFPQYVVRTIVGRTQRRGYFVQSDRVLRPDFDRLETLSFRPVQQETLRRYETLVAHMIDFCRRRFGVTLTQETAGAALEQYFRNSDSRALAGLAQSALPLPHGAPPRNTEYLVGSFVQDLQQVQSGDLEYLDSVAKGIMLANGLYLTNPSTVQQKF